MFIAAARTAIPELLDALDAAERRVEETTQRLNEAKVIVAAARKVLPELLECLDAEERRAEEAEAALSRVKEGRRR